MAKQERQDVRRPLWTIDEAALHFGITRATVEKYIREGLPVYFSGTFVKSKDVIAEYLRRRDAKRATLAKKLPRDLG